MLSAPVSLRIIRGRRGQPRKLFLDSSDAAQKAKASLVARLV
jgi:hypothetical protein